MSPRKDRRSKLATQAPRDWRPAAGLLGGAGFLLAWRLAWLLLFLRLAGMRPDWGAWLRHPLERAWNLLQPAELWVLFQLHRDLLGGWVAADPLRAWWTCFGIYAAVCALCLSGTVILVGVAGALLGPWAGAAACLLGSSLGAPLAMLFSRRFLGGWMRRHFPRVLQATEEGLRRNGSAWLLSARLFPAMSFSLVNLAMGISRMRALRFSALSTLGLLPLTLAYAWLGSRLQKVETPGDLLSPRLWLVFSLAALLPLGLRFFCFSGHSQAAPASRKA